MNGRIFRQHFRLVAFVIVSFIAPTQTSFAIPPLVSGDVPTADKNHIEWFIGTRYQDTGSVERQIPFTELVYGISDRQEITFEIPYLLAKDHQGFGDATIGTKVQLTHESEKVPGVAASFEVKLANGSQTEELGSGAMEYEFRLRSQKTFGWFTPLVNVGYTFVGEPEVNGIQQERRNILFTAFAQEYEISHHTKLLSEIYWRNSDEPEEPNRFAGDIGFKHHLMENLSIHGAVGKSLRQANRGGPDMRIYGGIKLEFALVKKKEP